MFTEAHDVFRDAGGNHEDEAQQPAAVVRQEPAAEAAPGPLPKGWKEFLDDRTKAYYYQNKYTKEVQWERPTERAHKHHKHHDHGAESTSAKISMAAGALKSQIGEQWRSQMALLSTSKFSTWTREEMILLLVRLGIEVRGEELIHSTVLRDMCEQVFEGGETPPKPAPLLTESNFKAAERAVYCVQRLWIERRRLRSLAEAQGRADTAASDEDEYASYMPLDSDLAHPLQDDDDEEAEAAGALGRAGDIEDGALGSGSSREKFRKLLDVPWSAPDWQKAAVHSNFNMPRRFGKGEKNEKYDFLRTSTGRHCFHGGCGEVCDIFQEGQVSELGIYGPSVTNYFKLLKFLFWLFLILSLLGLPNLILNVYGPSSSSNSAVGIYDLASTTFGNLASAEQNATVAIKVPGCYEGGYYQFNCYMSRERVGLFYAWLDVIITVTLCVAFVWLQVFYHREERALNKFTVTTSMFSVALTNLPPDADERSLKKHVLKTMQLRAGPTNSRGAAQITKVCAIALGYDNEEEIQQGRQRGKLLKEKLRLTERHRYDVTKIRADASTTREEQEKRIGVLRTKFLTEAKSLSAKIRRRDQFFSKVAEKQEKALVAFVTFATIKDMQACVRAFSPATVSEKLCGLPETLKYKGKHLKAGSAPEPSTVIWENLSYPLAVRTMRRVLTTCAAVLLLVVSICICFGAKALQQQVTTKGGSGLCPQNFRDNSAATQQAYVKAHSEYLHCYCSALSYNQRATDTTCREYYISVSKAEALVFFAALVVVLVNMGLEVVITYLVRFERHHSEDTMNRSVFLRLFVMKYINTSGIFLILNNHAILKNVLGIASSNSFDFSSTWYSSVGVTLILVQLVNVATGHIFKAYQFWLFHHRLGRAKTDPSYALTQAQLNRLHTGPEFLYSENYAQHMATFFTTLTFATGLPLLYPIACINYFIGYFVDKYLFIHLYRTPPRLDGRLGREVLAMVPWAIVLHCGTSIWMLGQPELFTTAGTIASITVANGASSAIGTDYLKTKVTMQHTFILIILFGIIAAATIVYTAFALFESRVKGNHSIPDNSIVYHTTFEKACQRLLIKGETTYNILLSSKYREMLSLSWKFAFQHRHVRSIRFDASQQERLLEQTLGNEEGADVIEQRLRGLTNVVDPIPSSMSTDSADNNTVPSRSPSAPSQPTRRHR